MSRRSWGGISTTTSILYSSLAVGVITVMAYQFYGVRQRRSTRRSSPVCNEVEWTKKPRGNLEREDVAVECDAVIADSESFARGSGFVSAKESRVNSSTENSDGVTPFESFEESPSFHLTSGELMVEEADASRNSTPILSWEKESPQSLTPPPPLPPSPPRLQVLTHGDFHESVHNLPEYSLLAKDWLEPIELMHPLLLPECTTTDWNKVEFNELLEGFTNSFEVNQAAQKGDGVSWKKRDVPSIKFSESIFFSGITWNGNLDNLPLYYSDYEAEIQERRDILRRQSSRLSGMIKASKSAGAAVRELHQWIFQCHFPSLYPNLYSVRAQEDGSKRGINWKTNEIINFAVNRSAEELLTDIYNHIPMDIFILSRERSKKRGKRRGKEESHLEAFLCREPENLEIGKTLSELPSGMGCGGADDTGECGVEMEERALLRARGSGGSMGSGTILGKKANDRNVHNGGTRSTPGLIGDHMVREKRLMRKKRKVKPKGSMKSSVTCSGKSGSNTVAGGDNKVVFRLRRTGRFEMKDISRDKTPGKLDDIWIFCSAWHDYSVKQLKHMGYSKVLRTITRRLMDEDEETTAACLDIDVDDVLALEDLVN